MLCCYFVGSTEVLGRVGRVGETSFCCHLGRLFRYLNSMVTLLQECAVLPIFFPLKVEVLGSVEISMSSMKQGVYSIVIKI